MGLVAVGGAAMLAGSPVRAFGKTPLLQQLGLLETDRVLVLIQLSGGNDGLNTVVPISNDVYYNARPQIAIPAAQTAALSGETDIALHPSLGSLTTMYGDGGMAVLQNVGYPNPVLSHFDATDIWLSASSSGEISGEGWIGSYLDAEFPDFETTSFEYPLAVQMGGTSPMLFQGPVTNMGMSLSSPALFERIVEEGILYSVEDLPATRFGQEMEFVRTIANDSFVYAESIQRASESGRNEVEYPQGNKLAENLSVVARLIKGQLGSLIYHVSIGSFDTHANQGTANGQHANLLRNLAEAVKAFVEDIDAGGRSDDVLVATFSEFGRRVSQNGSGGTDHGTAAPLFVFGSGVEGGVYGSAPDLDNLDGTGNLQFEIDFRSVYATLLADWFGLSPETVDDVLGDSFGTLGFVSDPAIPTSADDDTIVPETFNLDQNYPNPFSVTTTISYALARPGRVTIRVYDSGGRLAETLIDEQQSAGRHVATFDAGQLAGGRYHYQVETEDGVKTRQMTLVR
ncbi:MAG: DUF1501 domain-containing protein [Rhodothermia bacterium]